MAKIMLVEDDNNLREIYEARLLAEGYQIVSAKDGEEALALAVKEKPNLIISDVMMPKISGFDMLDILRSTPETKDTKVIMMTALSQAEDKSRAGKLGADRYLVKSQVTLEDVAKVTREVLQGEKTMDPSTNSTPQDGTSEEPAAVPGTPAEDQATQAANPDPAQSNDTGSTGDPAQTTSDPTTDDGSSPSSTSDDSGLQDLAQTTEAEEKTVDAQINDFASQQAAPADSTTSAPPLEVSEPPAVTPTEAAADNAAKLVDAVDDMLEKKASDDDPATSETSSNTEETPHDSIAIAGRKVIDPPAEDPSAKSSLDDLVVQEEEKEQDQPASNSTLPASTVIDPSGKAVTPPEPTSEGSSPSGDSPGNVIQPGGDPNNVAL